MSASLMSCVRDNSPPLDIVDGANCSSATGPMSLPDCHMTTMSTAKQQQQQQLTSTPLTTPNINESSSSGGGGAGGGGDGTTQNTEPKRRRFHPLRNLRRIFRRRTITNVPDTPPSVNTTNTLPPPTSSTSEKDLRSATLSSISSAVSASSPSSPLTQQQLQDAYSSQSLPKSKSYSINAGNKSAQHRDRDALLATVLGGGKHKHQQQHQQQQQHKQQLQQQLEEATTPASDMYTTHATHTTTSAMYHHHQQHQQVGSSGGVLFQPPHSVRQSLGVAVLPSAMNRSFYAERQKLRSIGDSSQELDSSGNDSGSANNTASGSTNGARTNGCASSEMTDSQRSLSEGRLVDSDYSHDPLSQSHDSVFSESASASLFSNRDYQAELSDVLRKRNRHRQDASEEDLGLPRSPASPQRRVERTTQRTHHASIKHTTTAATSSSATTGGNHSEVSSLSLLSMNSGDGDELFTASTANNSISSSTKEFVQERALTTTTASAVNGRGITRASTVSSSSVSSEIYRHSSSGGLASDTNRDEPDLLGAKYQRLSHSAAKHKMALRPAKKKGPSRLHRRTLETSIPEANEDSLRLVNNQLLDIKEHDIKAKTRSLPPSVNTKVLDQHAVETKKVASPSKSKTKSSIASNEQILNVKRSKNEKHDKSNDGGKLTTSTTTVTTSSSSSSSSGNTSISAATNLFGLRTLTAKATALFEPPQESSTDPTPSEQELKREKEREKHKEKEKEKSKEKERERDAASSQVESTESGFLRRLIQRNSKRSGSRNNNTNSSVPPAEEKMDLGESETDAKSKVQVSTSCLDVKPTPEPSLTKMDKTRSALSYEQNIEETRKDIKREIVSVGSTGLNAKLSTPVLSSHNNNASSVKEATSPQKPKSGAAARQRYVPQDIGSLERKVLTATNTTASESHASSTSSILSKCSQQEIFQSTSIIREITASQASSVNSLSSVSKLSEHHYERKPKIVGLSAFQQKISRSNDSVVRYGAGNGSNAHSTSSLDAADETPVFSSQEQKQRKVVEKSRSFRTYQEEAYATPIAVHNNMPSLPDLTLNLRVPYNEFTHSAKVNADNGVLGLEAQSEKVTRVATTRTESTGNLNTTSNSYNFTKNITVKSSPTKTAAHTPSSACAQDETNRGDLLTKSPFINVLRKPTSTTSLEDKPVLVPASAANCSRKSVEQINEPKASPISLITVVPPPTAAELLKSEPQLRPKVLHLRDSNASIDTSTSTDDVKLTPTTAAVPLREKTKLKTSAARNSMDILAANAKDVERKSAPAPVPQLPKAQSVKTTRRSTSLMDSPPAHSQNGSEERGGAVKPHESTSGGSTPNDDGVPEFMRIQLNRVDPARIAKSANVVLAKNVREAQTPTQQQQQVLQTQQAEKPPQLPQQQQVTKEANNERNSNLEELSLRRLSNESVEIIEKASPTEVDKQKPIFDMSQNHSNNNNKSPTKTHVVVSALPPRSPIKKQQSIVTLSPTTPTTPPTDVDECPLLRIKAPDTPGDAATLSSKKLSLQERKRLFMSEEKLKTDKRIEELRNERKKSITEEVYRKSFAKSEEKLETSEKAACESVVMLRKKSFCATTQACASSNGNRDDATPELMKVFARRSLKIKDEDINALADKIHASNGAGNAKKFVATQQNVDSDKENQSASEEKLDKLPKLEASHELQSHAGGKLTNGVNNRNSLADFRTKNVVSGAAHANGLSLNNNNNNNNNNHTAANNSNNSTTGIHSVNNTTANNVNSGNNSINVNGVSGGGGGGGANSRSFLPPIKVAGYRAIPIERNNSVSKIYPTTACENLNNNNQNNNNSNSNNLNNNNHSHPHKPNGKAAHERQSLNIKALECNNSSGSGSSSSMNSTTSGSSALSKTIERSATVSEFKGIHQRRAEWEQRAKEALK